MQVQPQSRFAAHATIVAVATLGAIAGFWLGCRLTAPLAEFQLHNYIDRVAAHQSASVEEARTLLDTLQRSASPACSDAELASVRDLVSSSDSLKDAGRIHAGKIQCSATAGRPLHSIGHFIPTPVSSDDATALNGLVAIHDPSLNKAGIEEGSFFVLFGSHLPDVTESLPIHLASKANEAGANAAADEIDSVKRDGNTLVAEHCSSILSSCVTASVSTDEARQSGAAYVAGASVFGAIAGICLGLLLSHLRRRSLSLDQQLKQAVARDNLHLEYQPVVNLATGKIVGAEALARWTDRAGVVISPDVFIKAAEDHGFVGSITALVLKRALKEFRDVIKNHDGFRLSINIAPSDLIDPGFLPMVDEVIRKANVEPGSIAFEVTERSAATDQDALETIRELRDRGYKIYIDDFGTGYSNLSYLLYLSVDSIKIDRAFVKAIGTDSPSVAILPQIIAMARNLNLGVVAEGIEVECQAAYFPTEKIRIYGQGWFYGRPMPAAQFSTLIGLDGDPPPEAPETGMPLPQLAQRVPSTVTP